jgi:hypothetical protein
MAENEAKHKGEFTMDEMSPISPELSRSLVTSEYKVGHNKPPLFLIVLYVMVVLWCAISWIPFNGY